MCNCRNKAQCPLENKCLTEKLIYQAEIVNDTDNEKKRYIGLAETTFKQRYSNHLKSFKHKKYSKETELSKYVWELKDNNRNPTVNWTILKSFKSRLNSNRCILCLSEKMFIIKNLDDVDLLNKRSEFISKCRHINKYMLKNVKKLKNVKDSKD